MSILAIIGSSKNGNTTEIIRYIEKKMLEKGGPAVEYLYLSDYDIDFCTGCHNCIFIGEDKCPHRKNVQVIEDRIMAADALILATPGYMFSVTGIMKNFLDHVAYNCHRPKYFGKKAYLIGCCTKFQEKGVFIPMETWLSGGGFSCVGKTYIDLLPFPMSQSELDKRRKKLDIVVSKLHSSLSEKVEVRPDFSNLMIFHAFRTLCKVGPHILKADFEYFNKINAYDKGSKYYVKAKVPAIKHFMANFIERSMQKEITGLLDMDKLNEKGSHRNTLL